MRLLPLLLLTPLLNSPSHALQALEGTDGATLKGTISLKEPTRIRIEGAAINEVFGNVYSNGCGASVGGAAPPVNPLGEIALDCDREKGEIYVRPVGIGQKPINLFISSATGTYTLVLERLDIPAETIVIKDKSARQARAAESVGNTPAGRSPNHIRSMKTMLIAMSTDRLPSDIRVEEVRRPVTLWAESRFTLEKTYEGRGLIGEKYHLTNISGKSMVVAEQEFDREADNVVGVAVEVHTLRPGESTNVYVLRAHGS